VFDELLALRWRPTPEGRIRIEAKEELRARLGRSPDRADAVCMAFGYEARYVPRNIRLVKKAKTRRAFASGRRRNLVGPHSKSERC